MNFNLIFIIGILPFLLFTVVFFYLIVIQKNAFTQQLSLFRPTHELPQKREAYMQNVRKHRKYISIFLSMIIILPFIALVLAISKENLEKIVQMFMAASDNTKILIIFSIMPIVIIFYIIIYILRRNEKAQRMLLEQMSEEDFDFLSKVKNYLNFFNRYSPPFLLCNKRLYIFLSFGIREIDITEIKSVEGIEGEKRSTLVHIQSDKKKTTIVLSGKVFSFLKDIIEKYNPSLKGYK